jgi:phosphohistidine phosphatase
MHLYVMRHGPAEDRSSTGRDADRALTLDGRERVRRISLELHRVRGGAPLPRLLVSPLVRACETAAIVANVCGAPEIEVRAELSLDADLPLSLAAELAEGGVDTLLVGHQPTVEQLVRALGALGATTGPRAGPLLPDGFCTALIVALEPELSPRAGARWHLRQILDPRTLA